MITDHRELAENNELIDAYPFIIRSYLSGPKTMLVCSQVGIENTEFMLQCLNEIAKQKNGKVLILSLEGSESQFCKAYRSVLKKTYTYVDDTLGISPEWLEARCNQIKDLVAVGIDHAELLNLDSCRIKEIALKFNIPIMLTSLLSRCASDHKNGGRPWISDIPYGSFEHLNGYDYDILLWREHLTDRMQGGAHLLPIGDKAEAELWESDQVRRIFYGRWDSMGGRYLFYTNQPAEILYRGIDTYDLLAGAIRFLEVESLLCYRAEISVERNDISSDTLQAIKLCAEEFQNIVISAKERQKIERKIF